MPQTPKLSRPQSWSKTKPGDLRGIRGVCFDIDDTFSSEGKITAEAFDSLWRLKRAGFLLVPVTGRPAGWCDHIARFWPVDAVVGENGAFTFFMRDGRRERLDTLSSGADPKLARLRTGIAQKFTEARWASDQAYREYDLAIDICEDVPAWSDARVEELLAYCRSQGAHAKLSSVHVNTWFGDYSKRQGFERWLKEIAPASARSGDKWIYAGDSPNDEPMFEAFNNSVGVANLKRYLPKLTHPPRWITGKAAGAGFAEMAAKLIAARKKR